MDATQTVWEQETLTIILDVEGEKRRAEQRVEVAKQDVQKCTEEVTALYALLDRYRRKHGMPLCPVERSPVLEAEYSTLTPWAMLERWAQKHDGNVIMRELCNAAIAAGIYTNYQQAAGTFYSLVRRKSQVEKLDKGHYFIPQKSPVS